jgi:ABC-type bacteriocin/lantibiotic exporter with double-glycine peptidase domain
VLQVSVVALGFGLPALTVIPLDIQKRLVDDAIPAGDSQLILHLAVAFVAATAASAVLKFVIYYLRGLIEARVTRFLRVRALDAHRRRSPAAARAALGPVSSVVVEESFPIGGFAAEAINTPLIEGVSLLTVAGFMLWADPWLAAVGLGAFVLQAVVVPIVQHRINLMSRRRVQAERRANADVIGATEGEAGLHLFDALREIRLAYGLRLRMNVYKAALKGFLKLSDNLAIIVVLAVGGLMVIEGETTLGTIVAFLGGLRRVREPWDTLIAFYRDFADVQIKYDLILGAMGDAVPMEPDRPPGPVLQISLP